ncbi:MAG: transglycosylase SLT domain-containing protein [Myxococcales bacterium]|nr:transglycosylase SLT domain-containing protein [Myxococcales bacterium]
MKKLILPRLHVALGALIVLSGFASCATATPPAPVAERHPPEGDAVRALARSREHAPGALADAVALTPLDAAVAARDRGDLRGAIEALESIGDSDEQHAEHGLACALLGITYFELNEYEQAGRVLARCDRSGPVADLVAFVRGEVLRGLDRPLDAVKAYELALSFPRSPNALKAQFRRADALFEAGPCDAAVPTYRKLLETFPEYPAEADVRLRLAECGLKSGEKRRATEALVALSREVPGRDAGVAARLTLGRLRALGVPLPEYGFDEELRHAIALRDARRWPEALVVLDGLTPELPAQQVQWHRERSKVLESLDRYAEALAALEDAEREGARDLEDSRIRLLRKLGRTDEAVKRSQRRVSSRRERLRIAADLYYRDGEYGKALDLYRQVAGRRRDPDAQWHLAWLEYRAGSPSVAANSFARLAGRGVEADKARYWQARAEAKAGRVATAKRLFGTLAEAAPLSYYGIQAANRLLDLGDATRYAEVTGARPDDVPSDEERGSTFGGVLWRGADGTEPEGALTRTRKTKRLREAIADYGHALPELERALARYRMGLDDAARIELRIALSELHRVSRGSPKRLADTAGSLYVDFRAERRGVWGSRIGRRLGLDARGRAEDEARLTRVKGLGKQVAGVLRSLLVEVGDPYWTRRTSLRDLGRRQWERPSRSTRPAFRGAYPMAFQRTLAAETERRGVPPFLLTGLMRVESGFNEFAVSVAGARGLLQVMPVTGNLIASRIGDHDFAPADLLDAHTSITYGSWYIGELLEKFRGQEPLAIIAYNAGPHRVHEWLSRRRSGTTMDEFIEEVPYDQARKYVKSVLRTISIYRRVHADRADLYVGQSMNTDFRSNINW